MNRAAAQLRDVDDLALSSAILRLLRSGELVLCAPEGSNGWIPDAATTSHLVEVLENHSSKLIVDLAVATAESWLREAPKAKRK
jgi:hypothetical protein